MQNLNYDTGDTANFLFFLLKVFFSSCNRNSGSTWKTSSGIMFRFLTPSGSWTNIPTDPWNPRLQPEVSLPINMFTPALACTPSKMERAKPSARCLLISAFEVFSHRTDWQYDHHRERRLRSLRKHHHLCGRAWQLVYHHHSAYSRLSGRELRVHSHGFQRNAWLHLRMVWRFFWQH